MPKYIIITAAKDEGLYIRSTLISVVNQTLLPQEWIIIDDGSKDNTSREIADFAKKYHWITYLKLENFRPDLKTTGGRVGHILNIAASKIAKPYDIIVKLDADTEFHSTFFQELLSNFSVNKKLGIASGHLIFLGEKEKIDYNSNITRGAVMAIREEVFSLLNGFTESKGRGEDTLFSVGARYYGWDTKSFPVFFNHLKPEGKRHSSIHESFNTGYYKGSIPYMFIYFLFTQIKHIVKRPLIIGVILQLSGYIHARWIQRYRPFAPFITSQVRKEQKIELKKQTIGLKININ